jgi:uncharacterized membrane protein YeiB
MTPITPATGPVLSTAPLTDNQGVILHRTDVMTAAAATVTVRPPDVTVLAPPLPPAAPERSPRIIGFDLARALAIMGMLIEHCAQVFGPREAAGLGALFLRLLDGRASGVFVVLAGVGVSLLGRGHDRAEVRATLLRRGSILFLVGVLNRVIWPGDILRLFGVTMMAAGLLSGVGRRWLLALAVGCVVVFPVVFAIGTAVPWFDYDRNWDWGVPWYRNAWTADGFFRGLFYNGYRPVFPWGGLLLFGMWLGRLDVRRPVVRWRILGWGVAGLLSVETISYVALRVMRKYPMGFSEDTVGQVFDTGSMPPMPPFMLSVTATALIVIGLCLIAGARWSVTGLRARALRALSSTGQMALTWYVLHIAAGAMIVRHFGWHYRGGSVAGGLAIGLIAFAMMVVASAAWRRRFNYGPFEYLLRAASRGTTAA